MPTAPEAADLVERYMPLARNRARWLGRGCPWLLDDLVSVAAEALWKAATRYAPGGVSFAGFAAAYVRFAVLRRIRDEKIRNREAFRRAEGVTLADGERAEAADLLADDGPAPDHHLDLADDAERLRAALADLPEHRRRVVEAHGLGGAGFEALAADLGCTPSNVRQLYGKALGELRRSLTGG